MAIGSLHHRYHRRDVVVGRPLTLSAEPGAGRLDGVGAAVQQRDLCRVDVGRWAGNAAVHLFHRRGGRLPEPVPKQPLGPAGRVAEPGRGRIDATGGPAAGACCFSWFAVQRILTGERSKARLVRQIIYLVAPFAVLIAAHFLFRYAYYGEWLPNTYYAKHVRPWYESGFRYLWAAALETGL